MLCRNLQLEVVADSDSPTRRRPDVGPAAAFKSVLPDELGLFASIEGGTKFYCDDATGTIGLVMIRSSAALLHRCEEPRGLRRALQPRDNNRIESIPEFLDAYGADRREPPVACGLCEGGRKS